VKDAAGPARAPAELDELALELIRSAARFTRLAGRVPGVAYSAVAWRVLSDLEADGPVRVSALAEQQRVAQPTMTALLRRLEGEGWVVRDPDPDDGRATLVRTTPAGLAALDGYRRAAAGRIRPSLARLSADERRTLVRAARLMQRLGDSI